MIPPAIYILNGTELFKILSETPRKYLLVQLKIKDVQILELNEKNETGKTAIYYDVDNYNIKDAFKFSKNELYKRKGKIEIRRDIKEKVFIFDFLILDNIVHLSLRYYYKPDEDDEEFKNIIKNKTLSGLIKCS
jgi:hypothetical protein